MKFHFFLALCFAVVVNSAVIGIDFSSSLIKVGLVKPGTPFHLVEDETSKKNMPNMLSFTGGDRFFGSLAKSLLIKSPDTTFPWLSRILMKSIDSLEVDELRNEGFKFNFEEIPTRKTVGIRFKDSFDDNRLYHVEELLAMYLEYVRGLCAADAPNEAVKDVVLTIPSYWTQWEKQAIIDAAELAGFNVLSLLNENSAAIIQYGVDLKLEPNETQSLVVYNMGSRDIEATLVKFSAYVKSTGKKTNTTVTQAEIISHESDPHLGGVNFENIIVQFLLKKAQAMFPDIAVHKNSRIMSKLRGSAEKAKMVLSANMETPIYIENLLNDKDLRAVLTRAEFLTLSEPLLNKVTKPLEALCTEFAIDASTMDLLVIGGGTRIPAIQERLKAFIGGRDLRMNLDSDEAIALGSVFRAANQSTAFQVRKFGFSDVLQYPVDVHIYDSDYDFKNVALSGLEPDESVLNKHAELFRRHNKLNKKKTVTLNHKADFGVNLAYSAVKGPQTPYPLINEYFVDGLSDFTKKYANLTVDQVPKVSLSFLLDESGMVSLVRGVATLEEQVKVPKAKPALVKKEAASEASVESETGAEDSAVATEKVAEDVEKTAESADTEQQEFEMVTKTHSGELKCVKLPEIDNTRRPLDQAEKATATTLMVTYLKKDKMKAELAQNKNELEAIIYRVRNSLSDDLAEFSTDAERESIGILLTESENWLFEQSNEFTRANIQAHSDKVAEVHKACKKLFYRREQAEIREEKVAEAHRVVLLTHDLIKKLAEEKPWVAKEDLEKLYNMTFDFETKLNASIAEQAGLSPSQDPVLHTADISKDLQPIAKLSKELYKRPQPTPPKEKKDEKGEKDDKDKKKKKKKRGPAGSKDNKDGEAEKDATAEKEEEATQGNENTEANTEPGAEATENKDEL